MEGLFPTTSNATLAALLRRTVPSITLQASKMQIKKLPAYRVGLVSKSTGIIPADKEARREWLHHQHWTMQKPVALISKETGIERRNLGRYFKEVGVPTRTIAQDNARRYEGMTYEQRMAQVAAAHARVAELNGQGTSIEVMIRDELTRRGIGFDEQKKVGPFFVDFYVPALKLVIECDGEYWHSRPEQVERDARKNSWLLKHGQKVVRLTEVEIRASPAAAVDRCVITYVAE